MQQHGTKSSGFSLIEILISVTVLSSTLIALTMLLSYVIKSGQQADSRVIATELAQEGLDFFRQERFILGWNGLSQALTQDDYCLNDIDEFSTDDGDNVFDNRDDAASCNYEQLSSSLATKFKRTAVIEKDGESNTITVVVEVFWQNDQGNDASVQARIFLMPLSYSGGVFSPITEKLPAPRNILALGFNESSCSSCCLAGATYYYRVYAYDKHSIAGTGSSVNSLKLGVSNNLISIQWDAVTDASFYKVFVSLSSDMLESSSYWFSSNQYNEIDCQGGAEQPPE